MTKFVAAIIAVLSLLAVMMVGAGAAQAQSNNALPAPSNVTAVNGANPGEVNLTWDAVPGASHYRVGWIANADFLAAQAAGTDFFERFAFVDIAGRTSYTATRLTPGEPYWFIVGSQASHNGKPIWSDWASLTTTAGHAGDGGLCPITGLPLGDGYLSVGGTTQSPAGSFTLTTATAPTRIRLPYADDPDQLYSPRSGRRFVEVCGNYRHDFNNDVSLYAGWDTIMDSDAGSGFPVVDTHERIAPGVTGHGCQIWDLPATAATAVYAVSISGYNSQEALSGAYNDDIGLYRIDLGGLSTTSNVVSMTTGTPTPTTPTTPLTNEELVRHVKPALAQIVATNSDGETYGGTGFVVRSNGLMVTSRHVVDDADTVTVYMQNLNGRLFEYTGRVLGRGILADLAVVQLPAGQTYPTLPLGDSDAVAGGAEALAMGYTGGSISGTYPTITRGIISSKGTRGDLNYFQTDAAINPGNSGGPLVDQYGRVIGVNTSKIVDEAVDSIGFAIASNEVSRRLDTLAAGGPASATYRNLRFGYGYSVDILAGWYLDYENASCTAFYPYHGKGGGSICTRDLADSFTDSSDKLAAFAEWRWNRVAERASERGYSLFEPISFRLVESAGKRYYQLEYRQETEPQYCISYQTWRVGLSSAYPENPYGFAWGGGVCENSIDQYGPEGQAMLDSFRP